MLALPREEYDWFDVQGRARQERSSCQRAGGGLPAGAPTGRSLFPGVVRRSRRLAAAAVLRLRGPALQRRGSPAASTTPLNETRKFRALPRDRSRRRVVEDLQFVWEIAEGEGSLQGVTDQEVEYRAPAVPGLARLKVTVTQRDVTATAEALITVTDSLESAMTLRRRQYARLARVHVRARRRRTLALPFRRRAQHHRGQQRASRFRVRHPQPRVAVALSGTALRQRAGAQEFRRSLPADQLLERMIELSLYAEEKVEIGRMIRRSSAALPSPQDKGVISESSACSIHSNGASAGSIGP